MNSKTISKWLVSLSVYCHQSTKYFYWVWAVFVSLIIAVTLLMEWDYASFDEGTFDDIMEMRWTSPKASPDIVILDIDEKSLAKLAPEYGRWPWARHVYAEVLAELEYIEAKSIMFTPLITDPDKAHPRSDDTLSFVASESFVTVYPMVRLNKKFDKFSKLNVCDVIPAGVIKCLTDKTAAILLPGLPGMRHDLGMMNHKLDEDGKLRQWSLIWEDEGWKMPTVVGGILSVAQMKPKVDPNDSYILNWRDDDNTYTRVSFSDYLAALDGEGSFKPEFFRGKHVIISASAPGISVQQVTAIGLMDDGKVMATALDDAMHGTDLKTFPDWAMFLSAGLFVWALAALFTYSNSQKELDIIFVVIELGTVVVMAFAINYIGYFVDIMPVATFGLMYYSVTRVHHEMAESVFMGTPNYLQSITNDPTIDSVSIIALRDEDQQFLPKRKEMIDLQKEFAGGKLFFCSEPFQDDQILESMNDISCIVVVGEMASQHAMVNKLETNLTGKGAEKTVSGTFEFPDVLKNKRDLLPGFVTLKTIGVMALLPVEEG